MKINKIKVFFFFFFLLLPSFSLAQWSTGDNYGLPDSNIYGIIENILLWILSILGFLGIIGFAVSGIMYLISAGDDDMASKAKKGMTYSIYGVIVGLIGFIVIQAVDAMLNGWDYF